MHKTSDFRKSFFEPHARAAAIFGDEFDARGLEREANISKRPIFKGFASLQSRNRIGRNVRQFGEIAHAKAKSDSGHFALDWEHFVTVLRFLLTPHQIANIVSLLRIQNNRRKPPARNHRFGERLRLVQIGAAAMKIQFSHLFRDPHLKAVFAAAERDPGQEPAAAVCKQPKPKLSGGAARRVRELVDA